MITFDGIIFSSRNRLGGVSVYFRRLLQQTAGCLEDVAVLVYDRGITAASLGCNPQQLMFKAPRFLERFRSLGDLQCGLLHSSYYRTSAQRCVRNVITVYDFTYEKFTSGPRAMVHTKQKRDAIKRADAVICISENTRRDLLQFLPDCAKEKVFVTHLAAGDEFRPLDGCTVALTARPFALFVGGRGGYKNFAVAVEAVRRARECALVCVGGEPFSAQERAILERALPGRYFHAGPVDVSTLNDLYNAAVCLLYPSLYEGFGIPPLEAMKAGCPFIALNRSSIPEVAGAAGIVINESDPELIAAAINDCAAPARRAELRSRGFAQASKFSWSKTFEETLSIYRRLLS